MKNLAAIVIFCVLAILSFAQCTPDFNISAVGFYPPDTLVPCAEDSIFYDEVLQFKNFDQIDGNTIGFPGVTITIVSVQIDSVRNMPAGLSYDCNTPDCYYLGDENGCVRISGTTNIAPGVYNLGFYATLMVSVTGGTNPFAYQADSALLASNGLGYRIVVINKGSSCPNKHSGQLYFNATVTTPSYCEGDTVSFHALASGGTVPYAYLWSPGTNLSNPTGTDPLLYPTHAGTYFVSVTDNSGKSATDSVVVDYVPFPNVTLTSDTSICPGDSVQLTASGGSVYNWSPATGLDNANIRTPIAAPSQTTTYKVVASNANCSDSAQVTVTIDNVHPQASFNSPIMIGNSAKFINTSTGASTYFWDFGDGTGTSTEKDPNHQYTPGASYIVTLIAGNSCNNFDTVTAIVDLTVGIGGLADEKSVEIYPNPGTGIFQLKMVDFPVADISYEVMAVCGEVIKKESLMVQNNAGAQLDLSERAKGIYFLKVTSGSLILFKKIVLQ